jgi:hypothetical protein
LDKDRDDVRSILEPVANNIILALDLGKTHKVKTGSDAVEIVPFCVSPNHTAHIHLSHKEVERIVNVGLGKDTAVHNFNSLFEGRRMLITGDSTPDLQAMKIAKEHYGGKGIYVSNGHALPESFRNAVDHTIPHFTMTWKMIGDTVKQLQEIAPIHKIMPGNVSTVMPRLGQN